jgi:hypothetical protein
MVVLAAQNLLTAKFAKNSRKGRKEGAGRQRDFAGAKRIAILAAVLRDLCG